jgi:NAD(P)-dependent dehydrogenase (short-subunit alcohol dehydrogenase family)
MGRLDGKVAIVTGGGAGLGNGVAVALAKEGAAVVITGRRQEVLDEAAEAIRQLGAKCLPFVCDVGNRAEIDALVAATVAEFGTVHILVNNAMSLRNEGPVETIQDEDLAFALQVGVYGTLYAMQAVFPYMKEQHWGRIINFGSGAAALGLAGRGSYATVKGAVHSLTRVAGREWGPYGITVNLISPVALNSRAEEDMKANPEKYEVVSKTAPLRRWGRAEEDIGRTVAWLASDEAAYVTTNNLQVDGGAGTTR